MDQILKHLTIDKLAGKVHGHISNERSEPIPSITVRAYDLDMRTHELLGEGKTDKNGYYQINYRHSETPNEREKNTNICIKVFDENETALFETPMDEVRFDASRDEVMDAKISDQTRKTRNTAVLYEKIFNAVKENIQRINLTELAENNEHKDITYLHKETLLPKSNFVNMVLAHRCTEFSGAEPEILFGLLEMGTIYKSESKGLFNKRFQTSLESDEKTIVYDIAQLEIKVVEEDISVATKKKIISKKSDADLSKFLRTVKKFRKEADEYYEIHHNKNLTKMLSGFVLEGKVNELEKILSKQLDFREIIDTLESGKLMPTSKVSSAKAEIAIGELLGFDSSIISGVRETADIKSEKELTKLAKLDKKGWVSLLEKSIKDENATDKKLINMHSSLLVRKFEKEFPTVAYSSQLLREKKEIYKNDTEVKSFFKDNDSFNLTADNVDTFFRKNKLDTKNNAALKDELKSVQRVFKLIPSYQKSNELLKLGIHSSQSIVGIGKTRFVNEIAPKAGLTESEAVEVYKKAEKKNTAAMIIIGEIQDSIKGDAIDSTKMDSMMMKMEAVSKDFPNLKSLFAGADMCECEHCRSVYSPAAYMVELLEFLDKRSVYDITTLPPTNNRLAKEVLFERRPDLADIDLSCANANTPTPYIDLVCEILESEISPDTGINFTGNLSDSADPLKGKISAALLAVLNSEKIPVTDKAMVYETESLSGSSAILPHYIRDEKAVCKAILVSGNKYKIFRLRQTLSSAEEIAASPEYVNEKAYTKLAASNFAFTLPFDKTHAEAKQYFERFDIDRSELMMVLDPTIPVESIAAESLGLTDTLRKIITTDASATQKDIWNTTSSTASDELKIVDTFLTKTGLSYKQLEDLISLNYISSGVNLFIKHLDLSSDTTKKEINNLDDTVLDRIHRFLRLHKHTKYKFHILDEIISQANLGGSDLTNDSIIAIYSLENLSKLTNIKIDELIGCFGKIPFKKTSEYSPTPLYDSIFANKAKNGKVDDKFLSENVNGTNLLSLSKDYLSLCLQIKITDLETLLTLLPNDSLTFANLSKLLFFARLVKKLKVKSADLQDLLNGLSITSITNLDDALDLVNNIIVFKTYPLSTNELMYYLNHNVSNITKLEIPNVKILDIVKKLQDGYQKAWNENKSKYDPSQTPEELKETVKTEISKLQNITEIIANTLCDFIDRKWTNVTDAKSFINTSLSTLFTTTSIENTITPLSTATNAQLEDRQKDYIKSLLDAFATYYFGQAEYATYQATMQSAFATDETTIELITLNGIMRQGTFAGLKFGDDILSNLLLIDTVNLVPTPPAITEVAFGAYYECLRLFHKIVSLVKKLKLSKEVLQLFFENSTALGWFTFDVMPYKSTQNPVDISKFKDFMKVYELSKEFSPVENPADPAIPVTFELFVRSVLPSSTVLADELLTYLALLANVDFDNLKSADLLINPVFNIANYKLPDQWLKLLTLTDYLTKFGITTSKLVDISKIVLLSTDVEILRTALKDKYDEDTWLETLKEITDKIRPQKRDALVAYLLATNPSIKDTNDLYDYYLIDTQMEACMPSSRIVNAHGTLQLFTQRCLMGLEPEAAADKTLDSGWEQWVWMRNYRVWEANRKVFLYPENWIEPELRDDKSFQFKILEDELLQNDLTDDNAEKLITDYLERLDEVSFLEIVATWYDSEKYNMYVFGRTKGGDPHQYYYRTFEKERYWTAWEKIELDITSNHLLAFMRNGRLSLAWPVFSEEEDPNPTATVPSSTPGSTANLDKVKRKYKIQLAISEFANGMWQSKKVSEEAITTPNNYTDQKLNKFNYNLMYFEFSKQILLFTTKYTSGGEVQELNGIFNTTGCKGYPELVFEGSTYFPDFYPDFKDSAILTQRFRELNVEVGDELSARTALSFFSFYDILMQTPGNFRVTYPLQFTILDSVALLFQYFIMSAYTNTSAIFERKGLKIPLGTLLPYFKEDSEHAYVITPGFYNREKRDDHDEEFTGEVPLPIVQRTASDIMKLIKDIIALLQKYLKIYQDDPAHDINALIQKLVIDPDYQKIIAEFKVYAKLKYGEKFANMYHPLICPIRKTLYANGVKSIFDRDLQLTVSKFDFVGNYQPTSIVPLPRPIEDVDFSSDGSYSLYNWEMFFHIPFLMATTLSKNQKFEESLKWYHYIFNPTGALSGTVPQKYWVTKPFYQTHSVDYISQRIDNLLYKVADPTTPEMKELEFAIEEWRIKPFKPHVVARFRPVAYQKALIMHYIDNLFEWGDYLFRQDTMESIVQATQMYILADKLLGPKPRTVPSQIKMPYETYSQIHAKLDAFGNALLDIENILPDFSVLPEGGAELPPAATTLASLYFCIPQNDKMLEYWDKIEDRLFKIRNCQNIEGIERSLALFAPPIDPAQLVKAAASGLDLSSIIAGLNSPLPTYRFLLLSQKALDFTNEVKDLGRELLSVLEKKDSESLNRLQTELGIKYMNQVKQTKKLQIEESIAQIEILKSTKKIVDERRNYYASIEYISQNEQLNMNKLDEALGWQTAANITYALGAVLALIPDFQLGVSGFGGSPHGSAKFGGSLLAHSTDAIGKSLAIFSTIAQYDATRAATLGNYQRRFNDWKLQERLALLEIAQIDKQITAAEISKNILVSDYKDFELQIVNAKKTEDFLKSKFTNKELYNWMMGQVVSVYFKSYKLAHDMAKKAERAYKLELGNDDTFINFGYWDSAKKGLQSANGLLYDINKMTSSYFDKNKREFEINKSVSLIKLDPLALVQLKATGKCDFTIPESLFDMDYPGQYFRRIKSVAVSIPCIAGPYTSVSAKLSLVTNKYRKNTSKVAGAGSPKEEYQEVEGGDDRFVYNVGSIESIATSHAQGDSGMFQLDFNDSKFLPFERKGAISSWRLELPTELKSFDYDTISDVIIHINYTSREGGGVLKTLANTTIKEILAETAQALSQTGLHTAIKMKSDMPNLWHQLKQTGKVNITIDNQRVPYFAQLSTLEIDQVMFVAKVTGNPATSAVKIDGANLNLARIDQWKLTRGINNTIELDTEFELSLTPTELAKLEDLVIVVKYII